MQPPPSSDFPVTRTTITSLRGTGVTPGRAWRVPEVRGRQCQSQRVVLSHAHTVQSALEASQCLRLCSLFEKEINDSQLMDEIQMLLDSHD